MVYVFWVLAARHTETGRCFVWCCSAPYHSNMIQVDHFHMLMLYCYVSCDLAERGLRLTEYMYRHLICILMPDDVWGTWLTLYFQFARHSSVLRYYYGTSDRLVNQPSDQLMSWLIQWTIRHPAVLVPDSDLVPTECYT